MKKQSFPGHKLCTSRLKACESTVHGGPPALVSLRISVAFSRCDIG